MKFFKKKEKKIPKGNYRIIKIGKEALFEFIYEAYMENNHHFMEVSDPTSLVNFFDVDWEKGEFIFAARSELGDEEHLQTMLDTQKLLSALKNTTDTMFQENRYIELSEAEIEAIQNSTP